MYWKPRRFARLGELPDDQLFRELEAGLTLAAKNSNRLATDASRLADADSAPGRPARVLASHAREEAGKFLMLLDAARCPRRHLGAHLKRVGQHLPRLLYSEAAKIYPATFEELTRYIENNRPSHYLDGPEGVEWVFRNALLFWREQALYVDYIELEDRSCQWQDPDHFEGIDFTSLDISGHDLVVALTEAGLHQAAALEILASHWRSFEPGPDTHFTEVRDRVATSMNALKSQDILKGDPASWQRILEHWSFPLWGVDTSEKNVEMSDLLEDRKRYDAWH